MTRARHTPLHRSTVRAQSTEDLARRAFMAGASYEGREHFGSLAVRIGDETRAQVGRRRAAAFVAWFEKKGSGK